MMYVTRKVCAGRYICKHRERDGNFQLQLRIEQQIIKIWLMLCCQHGGREQLGACKAEQLLLFAVRI